MSVLWTDEHVRFEFDCFRQSATDFSVRDDGDFRRPFEPFLKWVVFHEAFYQIGSMGSFVFAHQTDDSVVNEPARLEPFVETLFPNVRNEPTECHKAEVTCNRLYG